MEDAPIDMENLPAPYPALVNHLGAALYRDAATIALLHRLDEFVRLGDGCVHVRNKLRDLALDAGGFAAQ